MSFFSREILEIAACGTYTPTEDPHGAGLSPDGCVHSGQPDPCLPHVGGPILLRGRRSRAIGSSLGPATRREGGR